MDRPAVKKKKIIHIASFHSFNYNYIHCIIFWNDWLHTLRVFIHPISNLSLLIYSYYLDPTYTVSCRNDHIKAMAKSQSHDVVMLCVTGVGKGDFVWAVS